MGRNLGFTTAQLMEKFDEMLNSVYDPIKIAFYTFMPAQVLKKCDPIVYHEQFLDYIDFSGYVEDPSGVSDYVHVTDLNDGEDTEEDQII